MDKVRVGLYRMQEVWIGQGARSKGQKEEGGHGYANSRQKAEYSASDWRVVS